MVLTTLTLIFCVYVIDSYINVYLLSPASALGSRSQFNLTECIKPPHVKIIQFQSTQEIFIHFQFANSEWTHYHGFVLTIQQLGRYTYNFRYIEYLMLRVFRILDAITIECYVLISS